MSHQVKMIENTYESEAEEVVNTKLLDMIKNFISDLSSVPSTTTNTNFLEYSTLVKRIDNTKIKSYTKLIEGFRVFFNNNQEPLLNDDFNGLYDPNISYVTDIASFSFNFQKCFLESQEEDQDVIKDHLNHIWLEINNNDKTPEDLYITQTFKELKLKFDGGLTKDQQILVVKDLVVDFQKRNLNIPKVVKATCLKARKVLNAGSQSENALLVIDAVEEMDLENFDIVQMVVLVTKITKIQSLFPNDESNPISDIVSTIMGGMGMQGGVENIGSIMKNFDF